MKNSTLLIVSLCFSLLVQAQDWHIYIGDTELNHIRRMTSDGQEQEVLFEANTTREIEMDEVNGKFWYIDSDLDQIRKCNLDGSSNTMVLGGLGSPNSIFLDHLNNRFFYSDAADSSIHVCDWNGENDIEILQGEGRVTHVEFDYCCEKLYWSDFENSRIARVNLDGTDLETVVNGIELPKDFEIDLIHQKLYWVSSGEDAKIIRSNMDGSDQEDLYSLTSGSFASIKIDHDNNILYCAEQGLHQLTRMNLDGSGVELLSDNFIVIGLLA
ncbi:MAG: DUF5050 domain-containing protein, partial [Flavobacteriales bacterium]